MQKRKLGKSGLEVSAIGFWCKLCDTSDGLAPVLLKVTRAMQRVRPARSSASLPSAHRFYLSYTALS
jgi:hypothetical protein